MDFKNFGSKIFTIKLMTASLLALGLCCWGSLIMANDPGHGGRVGNGGDWRRTMLSQAQREGANWVNAAALNLDHFDRGSVLARDGVAYKLVTTKDALSKLASDIIASRHVYRDGSDAPRREYSTCAWTNDPAVESLDDIVFSLDRCEGGLLNGGQSFANKLMIHESVHHLLRNSDLRRAIGAVFTGSESEQDRAEDALCDEVALAIQRVFEMIVLSGRPHWRDIEIPIFESDGVTESFEPRGFHVTAWTGNTAVKKIKNKLLIWGGCHEGEHTLYACGGDQYFNDGSIFDPETNKWARMSAQNAPSPRAGAGSAWNGRELFIWGGCVKGDGCEKRLADGGIYDPDSDRWRAMGQLGAVPVARVNHSVVYAPIGGGKLIIWGGHPQGDSGPTLTPSINSGAVYDVSSESWTAMDANDPALPTPRGFHSAVWTGETGNPVTAKRMFVWGGCNQEIVDACVQPMGDGSLFNPETMTWSKFPSLGVQPKARHNHSAIYVESQAKFYVFGGLDKDSNVISDGWILDLKTLKWSPMAGMSEGRFKHRAVWAGDKMLVFGGKIYNKSTRTYELADNVIAYVPSANGSGRWQAFKTDEMVPLKTIEHTAVWTGDSLLVWGGQVFDRGFTNTGSQFFPGVVGP